VLTTEGWLAVMAFHPLAICLGRGRRRQRGQADAVLQGNGKGSRSENGSMLKGSRHDLGQLNDAEAATR
jgi:hypothetical protein